MAAAAALSNYQLGDLLGRGASGQVYRALNFLTGETVAIKSVSLHSLAPSSLPDIMSEIDLLKNLNHPNIVKYKGFARDKENLFIVLEYCENGSLQSILKKFGKFPESLVAVYISQVLEGLIYLHEQGVIHRDIKGANILTNKDGSVKLADFGVSSRATGPTTGEGNDNEVVGSPYWMAPEVIEQSGASTASDIWSVGCVVVELLEGKPPYGDLAPMQALWRIVQDEAMRVPEGASPVVKDFLYHCFQKDHNLRISAKKLLRHPWMMSAKRNIEPIPTSDQPRSRTVSPTKSMSKSSSLRATVHLNGSKLVPRTASGAETMKVKKPITVYDEAVQRVQEWNEALNASPKASGTVRRLPSTAQPRRPSNARRIDPQNPLGIFALPSLPSRSSAEVVAAQLSGPAGIVGVQVPQSGRGGLLQKTLHASDVISRTQEDVGESWDDDFASDISFSKLNATLSVAPKLGTAAAEESDQNTLKPRHSPIIHTHNLPPLKEATPSRSLSKLGVEDYSDIALDEDMADLDKKLADIKLKNKARRGIMHPDDLRKARTLVTPPDLATRPSSSHSMPPPPVPQRSLSTPLRSAPAPSKTSTPSLASHPTSSFLTLPNSPKIHSKSPPGSRQNSLRGKSELSVSQRELAKYAENDEEDYDDIFDEKPSLGSIKRRSLQLTKRSSSSWHSDQDEWHDPFAEFDDDFSLGEDDLESQLLRDKKATLCSSVSRIVLLLEPSTPLGQLKGACDELLSMFEGTPEMGLEAHFLSSHGMLACVRVLELLESRLSREVAVRLLKIVNHIVSNDVDALESFCLVGGIPVIIPFTSKKHPLESRLEASNFVQQLTRSALTLQMFISCRGLRILVELLDEDYSENKTLILSSLEGIGSVFDLQSPTPRNDFCRMFVREGILDPLSTALLAILKDTSITTEDPSTRAVQVLLLFCQVAQADARVRDAFATRMIMSRLLKACDALPRKILVTAIKAIKHLSTSPQLIEVLQNSNAMEILVGILGKSIKGTHANEICSHIFQTVYSMTRLSKARQEEAASSGIIPLLKKVIQNKSPLKQFALPILCDLANAGKVSRRLLWQNQGMQLYLNLLDDPYWRVSALDAILAWMSDETARVEDVLLESSSSESLVKSFVQATGASFEGILDPLLKILRLSTSVTSSISTTPFFRRLSDSLSHRHPAVVKLNLLRLTRVVCDNHPDRATLIHRFDIGKIVDKLAKQDEAILVRELAKEIYPSLLFGNDPPAYHPLTAGGPGVSEEGISPAKKAPSSTMKRSTSDTASSTAPTALSSSNEKERKDVHTKEVLRERPGKEMIRGKSLGAGMIRAKEVVREVKEIKEDREGKEDKGRHKRKISRSQLRDIHWQTDENGRLKSVRAAPPPI